MTPVIGSCALEGYDAHPTDNHLFSAGLNSIDYKYQAQMWVEETNDHAGPYGPPVRWDLVQDGVVIARWVRQDDGVVVEVEVQEPL
jgi:hypothetical protein